MCHGGVCVLLGRRYGEIFIDGGDGESGGCRSRGGSGRRVPFRDYQNRGVADSKGLHNVLFGIPYGFQICQHFAC